MPFVAIQRPDKPRQKLCVIDTAFSKGNFEIDDGRQFEFGTGYPDFLQATLLRARAACQKPRLRGGHGKSRQADRKDTTCAGYITNTENPTTRLHAPPSD